MRMKLPKGQAGPCPVLSEEWAERVIIVEGIGDGRTKVVCTNPSSVNRDYLCRKKTPENSAGCVLRDTDADNQSPLITVDWTDKLLGKA